MLKVAVCDDVQEFVTQITGYLIEYQKINNQWIEILPFFNAEDLWEYLKNNSCDLIILDIELVNMNGVELGHLIREKLNDHTVNIIYVSAMDTYDRQLFDVQPLNFLSKPINKDKLYKTIDLAISLTEGNDHIYAFKDKNGSHRIKIKNILYFESFGHDFRMITESGHYAFRASLLEIMNELSRFNFIHVHRSYIVNYEHISSIKYENLIMTNGASIPISRNKRKEIRDTLTKLGGKNL